MNADPLTYAPFLLLLLLGALVESATGSETAPG